MNKETEERLNALANRNIRSIAADYAARVFLSTDKEVELIKTREELDKNTNMSGISNGIYANLVSMLEDNDN